MRDERALDQSAGNAAFLVEYYSAAVRSWDFDRDGRKHLCRRKARFIAERLLRAARLAGIELPEEVRKKAYQMRDFGRFRDLRLGELDGLGRPRLG